jgi:hypothetical protein
MDVDCPRAITRGFPLPAHVPDGGINISAIHCGGTPRFASADAQIAETTIAATVSCFTQVSGRDV